MGHFPFRFIKTISTSIQKKSFSKDEIIDFLNVYKNINGLPKVIESDFTDLKDKSKRSNGFGSIRLYILLKNNVVFVNEKGKTQSFEECMKYLKDGNYYI